MRPTRGDQARPSIRIPALAFLKAHGCVLSCIFLFFCKKNPPRAAARASAQRKTRRGMPPGLPA
jgi:hypothetical protein